MQAPSELLCRVTGLLKRRETYPQLRGRRHRAAMMRALRVFLLLVVGCARSRSTAPTMKSLPANMALPLERFTALVNTDSATFVVPVPHVQDWPRNLTAAGDRPGDT